MAQQITTTNALGRKADFLTVDDQAALITAAQDVPVTVDADGEMTYGSTPQAEAALERLTLAFMPAMQKAAKAAKVTDPEDAMGTVLAEFIAAVRRHDLTSDVPFSATISTILRYAVSDTDRTSDVITVRENVAARYWRLMHKHGFDVTAAYAECRDTSNGFDPITFLAVHNALRVKSLDFIFDATFGSRDYDGDHLSKNSVNTGTEEAFRIAGMADGTSPQEGLVATADLVRWLFEQVGDREESILRLRYGFRDQATVNALGKAERGGHLIDEPTLSDVEVAEVLGWARSTVSRLGNDALRDMRAAYAALIAEEEAE